MNPLLAILFVFAGVASFLLLTRLWNRRKRKPLMILKPEWRGFDRPETVTITCDRRVSVRTPREERRPFPLLELIAVSLALWAVIIFILVWLFY